MKIVTLVNTLKSEKVRLQVDGDRLLCRFPSKDYRLPPPLQMAIKNNKTELIQFLLALKQPANLLPDITPIERDPSGHPLSSQQQRLWFADQFEQGLDHSYNNAGTVHLNGQLDVAILQTCFNQVISRHDSLRTRFLAVNGQPLQTIDASFAIDMPVVEISSMDEVAPLAKTHAQQLFDLSGGQLLTLTLLKLSEVEHILLFNIHHIISDGWSIKVLFDELSRCYQAPLNALPHHLPELPVHYIDYAHWQQQRRQQGDFDQHLIYWAKQLAKPPELLELPTDHPRPAVQNHQGDAVHFTLPDALVRGLKTLSIDNGVTLFMTLLGGFKLLLWRYSQQTDVLVGAPIANRNQTAIEGLIGFFVNTLVLRSQIDPDISVKPCCNTSKTPLYRLMNTKTCRLSNW